MGGLEKVQEGVENGRRGLLHCVTRVLIRPCVLDSDIVSERGLMCLFQQVVRLNHYHNALCSARVSLTLDSSKATLNIRDFGLTLILVLDITQQTNMILK